MSATTITMSVPEARRRLQNTSGMSSEQVSDLQRVVDQFYAARPVARACLACHCMQWEERTSKDGKSVWCCAGCHRPSSLTSDEWYAEDKASRQAADAHLRATAAAPDPRAVLQEALAKLAEAKAALAKLDAALPTSRSAMAAAVLKHERAEAELAEVDARAASHVAGSFLGGKTPGPAPSAMAARSALAAAADALSAVRGAKALLDTQIADARTATATAQAFARRAATAVLVAERLEDLLSEATESRATYLESVSQLAWLLRSGAIPSSDARARQIVAGADTAPSSWPEARTAGTPAMEAALAALLGE